jgi:hypothetical protein
VNRNLRYRVKQNHRAATRKRRSDHQGGGEQLRFGGWNIIYINTHQSDETFLFYEHDPFSSHYITEWSGAARIDEGQTIKKWAEKRAPGFPQNSPVASLGM